MEAGAGPTWQPEQDPSKHLTFFFFCLWSCVAAQHSEKGNAAVQRSGAKEGDVALQCSVAKEGNDVAAVAFFFFVLQEKKKKKKAMTA